MTHENDLGRGRWIRNLLLYVAIMLAVTVAFALVGLATGHFNDPIATVEGTLGATAFVSFLGLVGIVPYLVSVEFLLRTGQHRRRAAVILGAIVPSALALLSQAGHLGNVDLTSAAIGILGVALLGGLFGALIRLPATA